MNIPLFTEIELTYLMAAFNVVEAPTQLALFRLNRLLDVVGCGTIIGLTITQLGQCYVRGMRSRTELSHISEMFDDTKMISGLYLVFHIALLNDFGRFALCMTDRLFASSHFSTDSPSLFVVVHS